MHPAAALLAATVARTVAVGCPGAGAASLSQALAAASKGDRVELCGLQTGAFVLGDGVALVGRDGAIIDGSGASHVVTLRGAARLENVTVRGDGGRLDRDDAAVVVEGRGGVVRRVKVEARGFGIYLRQATQAQVVDCEVQGDPHLPPSERGNGIHLWNTRASRVEGCRVRATRDGLYLSFAHHNLIARNDVGEVRFGIHYMYSDDNRVIGNRLHDDVAGAAMMFSKRNVFEGNACVDDLRYGLLFKDIDSTAVRGNAFVHDGQGLFIQQSAENELSGNRVEGNVVGVHISAGAYANLFRGNAFARNFQQVLVHGARDNRWDDGRSGNYWSDYTGTDDDGDGIGNTAYRAGDLAGYLADAYPLVRVLELGPAYDAIRFAEQVFPVLDFPGAVDHRPLMAPPRMEALEHR